MTSSKFDWYQKIAARLNGINSERSLDDALKLVLRESLKLLGFPCGAIRIDTDSGRARLAAESIEGPAALCFTGLSAPDCVCKEAISGDGSRAVLSRDMTEQTCVKAGFGLVLAMPIHLNGRTGGVFFAAARDAAPPDAEDVRLTESLLALAGASARRVLDNKAIETRAQDLETVGAVGRLITSKLTLKDMTKEIVATLGSVMETDEVNVVLYDDGKKELSFLASHFADGAALARPEVYPLSDGMNSWIVKNRKPLLMKYDTVEECGKLGIRHGGQPAKSWLGAPMFYKDSVVGVISVQSYTKTGLYGEREVELLDAVASQCAVAVENARLFGEVIAREEEKKILYFSLTHDLLSLLSPVAGYARLLKSIPPGADPEAYSGVIDGIINSTGRISRFVEDILVYAKVKSGKLVLNIESGDVLEAVESAVQTSLPELAMRRIDVFVNGQRVTGGARPAERIEARFDRGQMERVFLNLVGNALKHARSRIDIAAGVEGGLVVCAVSDDGQGVGEDQLGALFDEYYQGGSKKKGVGLGLPTVKKIITLHGGSARAVSGRGKGFTLEFSWPRGLDGAAEGGEK